MENVKQFLKSMCAFLTTAKMFPLQHPQTRGITNSTYTLLLNVLTQREELVVGIVEEEIIFDNQVLFDLVIPMQIFISHAKKKGIEKIHFLRGVQKEELAQFMGFLISKKDSDQNIQDQFFALGITNIKASKLTTPGGEKPKKEDINPSRSYENLVQQFFELYENLLNKTKDPTNIYLELKFIVFHLMENQGGRYPGFIYSLPLEDNKKVVLHSLNVALLATYFSSKLGLLSEDLLDVGVAALLHDIGKMSIILETDGEPPADVIAPGVSAALGAAMLLKHKKEFGVLPVIVAYEHGFRYDLKETPFIVPQQPHLASLIIAICNFYDSCHQQKDPIGSRIYELMVRDNEGLFHPQLVERFFKVIGIWPLGTVVLLSNGSVAIVREENENDIFCPKVEIISSQEGNRFIDLREFKEDITIVRALNPYSDGKQYAD